MRGTPEEPMMHDEQICSFADGQPYCGGCAVHCGRDALHRSTILHLKPIHGSVVVLYLRGLENAVTIIDNLEQRGSSHEQHSAPQQTKINPHHKSMHGNLP